MIQRIRRGIDLVVPFVSGILFLVGVASTVIGAIARTITIPIPVVWVEEVTRYSLIWATLLLMGIGVRKKLHTQFTLLEDNLKGRTKQVFGVFILLLVLLMFGILTLGGIQLAINNRAQLSPVLMISMTWPYLSIPVGALLVLIEAVMLVFESVKTLLNPRGTESLGGEEETQC